MKRKKHTFYTYTDEGLEEYLMYLVERVATIIEVLLLIYLAYITITDLFLL